MRQNTSSEITASHDAESNKAEPISDKLIGGKKRIIAFCLALLFFISNLPVSATADRKKIVLKESFVAVNTCTGSTEESLTSGGFSCTVTLPEGSSPVTSDESEEADLAEVPIPYDYIVESEATLDNIGEKSCTEGAYIAGESTRTAYNRSGEAITMQCLAVGTSCTVWGCLDEDVEYRLTVTAAQQIATQFDAYQQLTEMAFGDAYDVDGDGKLAIYCYDLDNNYPTWTGSFTSGFFRPYDLLREDEAATDCIHLDTFPGMSTPGNPLSNIPGCYTTLVHEYQHLINQSSSDSKGQEDMELYLNEAFSMAAEHMVCGPSSTACRVSWFNEAPNYKKGVSLCCWCGGVASYSNAFLFGQYMRTRYKRMNVVGDDGNGNTLFKKAMSERGEDTLAYLADLLNTTPVELICDFWEAVYRKEASGIHGFDGETWADKIQTQTTTLDTAGSFSCDDIYNGGARFFSVPEGATVEITESENVRIIPLGEQGNQYAVTEQTESSLNVAVHGKKSGTLGLALFSENGQMLFYHQEEISCGISNVVFSDLNADPTKTKWELYFFDESFRPICWDNEEQFCP